MLLLRYAIWKVTPVLSTSMRHQRSHSRQSHTPLSPDETSVGLFALDAGPGCQQGPVEGFLLLTPGVWSLCSKDERTAWFWLQAQCLRHYAARVLRPLSCPGWMCLPSRPALEMETQTWKGQSFHFWLKIKPTTTKTNLVQIPDNHLVTRFIKIHVQNSDFQGVYNINYKNKIEKMKKLSTFFSSSSDIGICLQRSVRNHSHCPRTLAKLGSGRRTLKLGWGISLGLCGQS